MNGRHPRRGLFVSFVALSAVTGLFAGACGGVGDPTSRTGFAASGDAETERTVAIYASVVRQLVTVDHTFGGGEPPIERVFIVDGAVEGAGNSLKTDEEVGARFSPDVREGIAEALSDLEPVEFVRDRDAVTVGVEADGCGHVRGKGVLITLGPIEGDGDRVEVPNELWFSCLGGQWLTYVVERDGNEWAVTGTTGSVAIS